MPDSNVVVFSGTAHRPLAKAICDDLDVRLSPVEITRFSNDCLQAQLQANCRQRDVYIVQPLVPPTQEHLMELLLMLDAARGASAASDHRGDPALRVCALRQEGRLPDLARRPAGRRPARRPRACNRVLTMTLHAPQVHGFFSVPVDHLTALGVLAEHFRRQDLDRHGRGLARPRQRQDRDPVLAAARAAGGRRQQAAARRRSGRDRRDRRRRARASAPSSSTTRSPPAGRSSSCSTGSPTSAAPAPRSPARTGCSSARRSSGCASTR